MTDEPKHPPADMAGLDEQIERLAQFIMHCIEGEPSQSQGAVDTAIRIMTEQATQLQALAARVKVLEELSDHWHTEYETLRDGLVDLVNRAALKGTEQ